MLKSLFGAETSQLFDVRQSFFSVSLSAIITTNIVQIHTLMAPHFSAIEVSDTADSDTSADNSITANIIQAPAKRGRKKKILISESSDIALATTEDEISPSSPDLTRSDDGGVSYERLKVVELLQLLRQRQLGTKGNKAELIARYAMDCFRLYVCYVVLISTLFTTD